MTMRSMPPASSALAERPVPAPPPTIGCPLKTFSRSLSRICARGIAAMTPPTVARAGSVAAINSGAVAALQSILRCAYHIGMGVSYQDAELVEARGARARTRKLMLETAIELMQSGGTPSVSDVAEAAEVSRATAYRYFPS